MSSYEYQTTATTLPATDWQTGADRDRVVEAVLGELTALKARLSAQERELAVLRAAAPVLAATPATASARPPVQPSGLASRRGLLTRSAAALAGLGLFAATAGGTVLAQPQPPRQPGPTPPPVPTPTPPAGGAGPKPAGRATAANELIMGTLNSAPSNNGLALNTELQNGGVDRANILLLVGQNASGVTTNRQAINSALNGNGNVALAGSSTFPALINGFRQAGVVGHATDGYGLVGTGLVPLRLTPRGAAPPNGDGGNQTILPGSLYYEDGTDGEQLWLYWDTGGWRRIAAQASAGVLIGITPTRVLDTRGTDGGPIGYDGTTGNPITPGALLDGQTRSFRVGGKQFGSFTFPADTKGIVCNLTIIGSGPAGGFVTLFPGGTAPNASSINPTTAPPFIVANFAYTALSSANSGNVSIKNVADTRHIIVDVTGYYR